MRCPRIATTAAPTARLVVAIVALFVLMVSALFFLAQMRADIIAGARAYVVGEGLWSKGQKDAVHSLLRYASTGDRHHFLAYERAIAIPLGDRQARLELESAEPNLTHARQAFLAGGNHPDDVDKLIWMYRRYRDHHYMERAIEIWAQADAEIAALVAAGDELDAYLRSASRFDGKLEPQLDRIHDINERLTALETSFSQTLSAASRATDNALSVLLHLATLLAVCVGLSLSWLIVRRISLAEQRADEETQIWASLAELSRELISSLETPTVVERLSTMTAAMLDADLSVTYLRDSSNLGYHPMAAYGLDDRQWERLAKTEALAIPAALAWRLSSDQAIEHSLPGLRRSAFFGHAAALQVIDSLTIPLRHGDQLLGVLEVGYRRPHSISRTSARLAQGIAQIGSVVLRNLELIDQLEEANRSRADFVGNVSHELRNPLHAIIGYSDLLREQELGSLNDEQLEAVERSARCSRELLELVNETLTLSRLERADLAVEVSSVDLSGMFADLAAEFEKVPRRPDVSLGWHADGALELHTDPIKLRMVMMNLVGNALKYTETGRVEVFAARHEDAVELEVRDTGVGIPPDMLSRIFDPFLQLGDGAAKGGVGLGLHIVRRLTTVLGGSIQVESSVGAGSTFRLRLPA